MIKVTYFAKKGCFMAGRDGAFFDEEAAVAELAKGSFRYKVRSIKGLFEISKGAQKGQKWGEKGLKSGGKEKFSFGDFPLSNLQKVGFLRKQDRPKKIDSG